MAVLFWLGGGILLGLFVASIQKRLRPITAKRIASKKYLDLLTEAGIILSLFFAGIAIGAKGQLFSALDQLGWQGLWYALFSIVGSTLLVWLISFICKRRGR